MSGESMKLSINIGGGGPSKPTNLELLMAKAKPAPSSTMNGKAKPKAPISSLFDDDDAPSSSAGPSNTGKAKNKIKSRPPINLLDSPPPASASLPVVPQPPAQMSRAERQARTQALAVDSTIYDYDSVYDNMKAAERAIEEAKKLESDERKPKYIENFLASAQTRRLDKLRAEEKMLSLEREKEGDEFKDKDKFVTEGYKKQMIEVRKAEEEEKKREEEMRKSKKGPGLTSLYKAMLDDSSAKHAAAVAAASGAVDSGPSLTIRPPTEDIYEPEPEYDPFLAAEARQQTARPVAAPTTGNNEDINDDGEVVNKRSLLKAGLNIMAKPKVELPNSLLTSQRSGNLEGPYKSRAVGTAASYTERMERERRRLAEQVKEEAERTRLEHEEKMRAEEEEARKRKEGDDGEAEKKRAEAKERFLARKRAREEADAESKKKVKADS